MVMWSATFVYIRRPCISALRPEYPTEIRDNRPLYVYDRRFTVLAQDQKALGVAGLAAGR